MDLATFPGLRHPLRLHERGDLFLLLHPPTGAWAVVTESGREIADLCDGHRTAAEVARVLADRYDLDPALAQTDTLAYLEHLAASGLLESAAAEPVNGPISDHMGEVAVHLTNRCNLDCRHCYAEAGPDSPGELAPEQVTALLDSVRGEARSLVFSGGEPLLYPAWREVAAYACEIAPTKLVTNGTLLTESDVAWLVAHKVALQVSLDGATAATHDWLRGPGSFTAVREAMGQVVAAGHGGEVTVSCTLHRRNRPEAAALVELAAGWGVKGVHFVLVNRHGRAADHWADLALSPAEHVAVCRELSALRPAYRGRLRITGCVGDFVEHTLYQHHEPSCPLANNLMVEANGAFLPCILLTTPEFRLGSLGETDPLTVFTSNARQEAVRACHSRLQPGGVCGECDWRALCQGACPGAALWQHGTLQALDGLCDLRRELYVSAAFAGADEALGQHPTAQ